MFTTPPSRSLRKVSETLVLPNLCLCWGGGGNDLSYLNHIIIAHYNASYGCRMCLKQAFVSSMALHNHKRRCASGSSPRIPPEALVASPAAEEGVMAAVGALPRLPPRRMARLLPLTPRAPAPFMLPRHHYATVDKRHTTTTSPARTQRTQAKRRK